MTKRPQVAFEKPNGTVIEVADIPANHAYAKAHGWKPSGKRPVTDKAADK